jgi:hypothetical protein
MKLIIMLSLLFSTSVFSEEECLPMGQPIFSKEQLEAIKALSNLPRGMFKHRPLHNPDFVPVIVIHSNFETPVFGKDQYWGAVYFNKNDEERIAYRDEVIAQAFYEKEKQNPDVFNYTNYRVKDINSDRGLVMIEAPKSEVSLKSPDKKFSVKTGGKLNLKVKVLNEKEINLNLDVVVDSNGKISKYLLVGSKRIAFDSLKINASKNFMRVVTILAGLDTIEFYSNGKVAHSIATP